MALGDSYSSGEGAPHPTTAFWWNGRNTNIDGTNICHRSASAYGPRTAAALGIGGANFRFVACSGALFRDLYAANPFHTLEPAQTNAFFEKTGGHTDLVTMTMGGNDFGFATILQYCLATWNCSTDPSFAPGINGMVARATPIFQFEYKRIKAQVSPDTRVVVLTYPQILPAGPNGCLSTGWGALSLAERTWLRGIWASIDAQIVLAGAAAGVQVVDVANAYAGFDICAPTPYAHGLYREFVGWNPFGNTVYSFHPNNLGHARLAALLTAAIPSPPAAPSPPAERAALDEEPPDPAEDFSVGTVEFVRGVIDGVVTDPDRSVELDLPGWAPDSEVRLSLTRLPASESDPEPIPTELGTIVADAGGVAHANLTLPGPEGEVFIAAVGDNPLGGVQVASAPLLILGACRATAGFPDVSTSHPFCEPIDWLDWSGITTGYPDGTFRPGGTLTRMASIAFLHRMAGSPEGPYPDPGFSDVPPSHPFFDEISWAAAVGVGAGFPDGSFQPGRTVTRQAMAAFLYRLAGSPDGPFPDPGFSDLDSDDPLYLEISWAASAGVVNGYEDGTFRAAAPLTRQATAALLYRMLGTVPLVIPEA